MRRSVNLYKFGQTVACADQSTLLISKDISHACSILKTLAHCIFFKPILQSTGSLRSKMTTGIQSLQPLNAHNAITRVSRQMVLGCISRNSGPQQWPAIDPIKQSLSYLLKTSLRLRICPIARLLSAQGRLSTNKLSILTLLSLLKARSTGLWCLLTITGIMRSSSKTVAGLG